MSSFLICMKIKILRVRQKKNSIVVRVFLLPRSLYTNTYSLGFLKPYKGIHVELNLYVIKE